MNDRLKVITPFTGRETLEDALRDKRAEKLLWLEILFNDEMEWERYLDIPDVGAAYEKACAWYARFKMLIDGSVGRRPLPEKEADIDEREYRRFVEVLNFVSG
jgi:hypothetical protein